MPALIRWEQRFETGDAGVDFDHQVLFALINEVHCSVMEGADRKTLRYMVVDFARYASRHFRAEEELMEACGYDDLVHHQESHLRLTHAAVELGSADRLGSLELCVFAYDWLIGHIRAMDLPMVDHLRTRRLTLGSGHTDDDDGSALAWSLNIERSA